MAYPSKAIANYFIDLASADDVFLTPMKLQKLIYYAHGLCLAAYGRPLLDEAIQAWQYGPVVPSLYHGFKEFGSGRITAKVQDLEVTEKRFRVYTPSIDDCPNESENEETIELLKFVWESYGKLSAIQLSNLTHEEGTPWSQAYSKSQGKRGVAIDDEVMREWFASRTNAA